VNRVSSDAPNEAPYRLIAEGMVGTGTTRRTTHLRVPLRGARFWIKDEKRWAVATGMIQRTYYEEEPETRWEALPVGNPQWLLASDYEMYAGVDQRKAIDDDVARAIASMAGTVASLPTVVSETAPTETASEEVARMVHAFGVEGRRQAVRDLAARVKRLEADRDRWLNWAADNQDLHERASKAAYERGLREGQVRPTATETYQESHGWELKRGQDVVFCPGCGFGMHADHSSEDERQHAYYHCPICGHGKREQVRERDCPPGHEATAKCPHCGGSL
jgi:hypothetical protein